MQDKWTWWEFVAAAILVPPALVVAIWLIGSVIDGAAQRNEAHDRCLKSATNG